VGTNIDRIRGTIYAEPVHPRQRGGEPLGWNTGRLFYDGDGNGAGAAVHFGTLLPGLNLSAGDFVTI
jgi:hypothetical protein